MSDGGNVSESEPKPCVSCGNHHGPGCEEARERATLLVLLHAERNRRYLRTRERDDMQLERNEARGALARYRKAWSQLDKTLIDPWLPDATPGEPVLGVDGEIAFYRAPDPVAIIAATECKDHDAPAGWVCTKFLGVTMFCASRIRAALKTGLDPTLPPKEPT